MPTSTPQLPGWAACVRSTHQVLGVAGGPGIEEGADGLGPVEPAAVQMLYLVWSQNDVFDVYCSASISRMALRACGRSKPQLRA